MGTTDESAFKIAFLGLSNAGKTSIIKSLTQEFEMLTVLKPTISVERSSIEFLGKNLVFWDFGGQDSYRENYLSKPERYFDGISYIFYVVDVQDPLVLVPNISYFTGIYKAAMQYSPKAKFIILFHKSDPGLKSPKDESDVKQKFLEAISPLLEADKKPVDIYQTSIYRLITIITAVSQPLFANESLYSNIGSAMKSFAETYGLLFSMLFTEKYFSIGQFITEDFLKGLSTKNDADFLKAFFAQVDPDKGAPSKITIDGKEIDTLGSSFKIQFGSKSLPFFLGIGFDDNSMLDKEGLEIALARLNENLQKIFVNVDIFNILEKINKK
jgi:hypothetical protein